jgi:DNA helicase-2/ATP-dependent DNA helicase PcrA
MYSFAISLRLFRFNKTISPKISHVFVDEFQDTGHPQYSLLCDMTKHCHAMTVIGDPNQSIYSWNGAKPAIFNQHLKRKSIR